MGVDFTHCKASWSYSGFGEFRKDLYNLAGFSGNLYLHYETGEHNQSNKHPLWPLFNHSDCDGHLTPEEMSQMLPALRELVPRLKHPYDRQRGQMLIDGMQDAVENHERLEFR